MAAILFRRMPAGTGSCCCCCCGLPWDAQMVKQNRSLWEGSTLHSAGLSAVCTEASVSSAVVAQGRVPGTGMLPLWSAALLADGACTCFASNMRPADLGQCSSLTTSAASMRLCAWYACFAPSPTPKAAPVHCAPDGEHHQAGQDLCRPASQPRDPGPGRAPVQHAAGGEEHQAPLAGRYVHCRPRHGVQPELPAPLWPPGRVAQVQDGRQPSCRPRSRRCLRWMGKQPPLPAGLVWITRLGTPGTCVHLEAARPG